MEESQELALTQLRKSVEKLSSSTEFVSFGRFMSFTVNVSLENEKKICHLIFMSYTKISSMVFFFVVVSSEKGYEKPTLMRFLVARSMDPDKAAKMFVDWQKWRASMIPPTGFIPESEVKDELEFRKVCLQGPTKSGHPLVLVITSKHFASKDPANFKKFVVYVLDKTIASGNNGKEIGGEKLVAVIDLANITYKNLDARGLITGFQFLQSYYPERLAKCYILHMPGFFVTVWKFVCRFLEKATQEKIVIVTDGEELKKFEEEIGAEALPEEYGGRAKLTAIQDVLLPQSAPVTLTNNNSQTFSISRLQNLSISHFFFLTTATMATFTHQTPQTHFLSRLPLRATPRHFSARVKMSLQESAPSLAVVGVTGAVGQEFLSVLSDRDFPYSSVKMLASKRSAGKRVAFDGREYTVEELTAESFDGVDIALFSAGGSISKEFGPLAAEKGTIVVDNSSAFRMVDGVPLVIPEVNPEAMKGIKVGMGKGALIANPNCSTIICLMAVTPLHRHAKVKRMVVSTYQAASGAGAAAMEELVQQTREVLEGKPPTCNIFGQQYAFNLFSHNAPILDNGYNEEEMKLVKETRKIWVSGLLKVLLCVHFTLIFCSKFWFYACSCRECESSNTAREILKKAPGVYIIDDRASNTFPTPLDVSNKDDVAVGRIRRDVSQDGDFGLDIFVCGDQIRKGAALNAVQIAEMLL
ncbi:F10B6.22 [Arabidopsis lyrata subsp. lyrata]|uniref:aspartate-semialdehyde dehydrogenase n=1 Tax=Arabidopsis lyrata subsp. lyrata TaxID=81972 RepID=D7KCK0_ARALL|nr:F10B6.22 [Arabidopsis lyrata subsp. lyrata]